MNRKKLYKICIMTKAGWYFIMQAVNMKTPVIFTTLLIEKSPQALPLGAACVASAVKHTEGLKDACDVQLLAFCKEDEDFARHCKSNEAAGKYIADKLIVHMGGGKNAPAIFCFSLFVWNRLILEDAARILREAGAICIAGGPEVTAAPDTFTTFDRVITGEGEGKVPQVIAEILGIELNGGEVVSTGSTTAVSSSTTTGASASTTGIGAITTGTGSAPTAPARPAANTLSPTASTAGLEDFPSPYLDGTLNPAEYGGVLWELARGCPFKCSYCYESKGEKKVRHFPRQRLEKELDLFARQKIPQVFVLDPTYNANKKDALDLLRMIARKTPDTFYYFEARAEFIDRELARAFTRLKCALQIGLQSSDENVLRLVNRPFNRKTFVRNIGLLNEEGVIFGLDVIYGLPGDSLRGFKESVNFAISLYPNNLELFCLSVLPGTDLYDRADSLHLEYEAKPPYHIIRTDRFSPEDLKRAEKIALACSCFYNQGRAVPWFNTILHALHMPAALFFEGFYDWGSQKKKLDLIKNCCDHKTIEILQKDFVREELLAKKKNRLVTAALDIITFNGALSRKTDTGQHENVNLNYPAEYIDSQYALDLDFFVNNVKIKKGSIRI